MNTVSNFGHDFLHLRSPNLFSVFVIHYAIRVPYYAIRVPYGVVRVLKISFSLRLLCLKVSIILVRNEKMEENSTLGKILLKTYSHGKKNLMNK